MSRSARTARTGVVAVAAAGVLLLSACAPTTTTLPYAPSDGERVDLTAQLRGLNLLVVSEGEGAEGALLGALANKTPDDVTFTIEAEGAAPVTVPVGAHATVYLGTQDGVEAILSAVDAIPGGTLEAALTVGDLTEEFYLPVMDGTLPEYSDYLP